QEKDYKKYTVNLEQRTCTCRYWQLSGLPCCHAISSIYKASKKLEDFIAPCFLIAQYKKTYQHCLQPVEGPDNWPISDMPRPLPPAYVKMPGRPKTERRREQGEAPKGTKLSRIGLKMKCTLCQKNTHNARKCPRNPEACKKRNGYIRRDAARQKKKQTDASTSAPMEVNQSQASRKRKRREPMLDLGTQQSRQASTGNAPQSTEGTTPQSSTSQLGGRMSTGRNRLGYLLFGNNY
ncbi:unnamed protein product, partial [Urochloa humidicola]